jgi:hypothetical protein
VPKRIRLNTNKEGHLRVWNIINPPAEPTHYPVNDVEHAKRLIIALAESQLLQSWITANVFGLEVYTNGDWEEWESFDGDQIDDLMREDDKNEQSKTVTQETSKADSRGDQGRD